MGAVLGELLPGNVIPTQDLARFAIEVAKGVYGDEEMLENKDM